MVPRFLQSLRRSIALVNGKRQLILLGLWLAAVLYALFTHRGGASIVEKERKLQLRNTLKDPRFADESFQPRPFLLESQRKLLSEAQLFRLKQIESGILTRKDIEIVISRHREDIDWSEMYSSLRTVYDKPGNASFRLRKDTAGNVIPLPNVGRESYTYLYHVVNNYYNLANVTVFTQASQPTRGYIVHGSGAGHLLANSTFHDFVLTESENGHFIFTAAVWLPTLAHRVRSGYNLFSATRQQALTRCPSPALEQKGGTEHKFDLNEEPFFGMIADSCIADNATVCSGISFWDKFIRLQYPPQGVVFFSQGAIFAATAAQIRRRPLSEYKALLAEVRDRVKPYAGYFLEWFWFYVMTSEVAPCPTTGAEFEWAKHSPFFNSLDLRERRELGKVHDWPPKKKKRRSWFI